MKDQIKQILMAGFLLGMFAAVGTALVSWIHLQTQEQIQENEKQELLSKLREVVPAELFDNDLSTDTITVHSPELLGAEIPVMAYRARKNGQPVAVILSAVARSGYNGKIKLLVGVFMDGRVAGVRVVNHKETPGLGDGIEVEKSDWVRGFDQRTLINPGQSGWRVKKDGGDFDQLTGATITPRAIVVAVYNALQFYDDNQGVIFDE